MLCPFCGNLKGNVVGIVRDVWAVTCGKCGAMAFAKERATMANSQTGVAAWETRVPDTTRNDALEEAGDRLDFVYIDSNVEPGEIVRALKTPDTQEGETDGKA